MTPLLHLAYALSGCSWLFKDMLLLRSTAVCSSTCFIVNNLVSSGGMNLHALFWQILFIVLNGIQLVILVNERRGIVLDEADTELWQTVFAGLGKVEFVKVRRLARYERFPAGSEILRQGEAIDRLLLILNGQVEVTRSGNAIGCMRDGHFVGAAGFFEGKPAPHSAVVTLTTRALVWDKETLTAMLGRNPTLRLALQGILAQQMMDSLSAVSSLAGRALSPFAQGKAGAVRPGGEALFEGNLRSPYYQARKRDEAASEESDSSPSG